MHYAGFDGVWLLLLCFGGVLFEFDFCARHFLDGCNPKHVAPPHVRLAQGCDLHLELFEEFPALLNAFFETRDVVGVHGIVVGDAVGVVGLEGRFNVCLLAEFGVAFFT